MDFRSHLQQETHANTKVYPFEEFEEEDDAFYDELRRQVLQLTAEDDDYDDHANQCACENQVLDMTEARKQDLCKGSYGIPQPRSYYNWAGSQEDCAAAAPAWILSLWRNGNGTGVFIPQTVQSRGKNMSRQKKNKRGTYRRVERMN